MLFGIVVFEAINPSVPRNASISVKFKSILSKLLLSEIECVVMV